MNRILQGPSCNHLSSTSWYVNHIYKKDGKYWAGQSNKTSEMNFRIFLMTFVLILSVVESFSLTGMMKLRKYRLRKTFHGSDVVRFIKNQRTIVTKISVTRNNLFKIKNKSFKNRSRCSNCNSRGSRFFLWSKRFQ